MLTDSLAPGDVVGALVVIERADRRRPDGAVRKTWLCRCVCGVVKAFRDHALRARLTRSCGCLAVHWLREQLTGRRFGKLTVREVAHRAASPSVVDAVWRELFGPDLTSE